MKQSPPLTMHQRLRLWLRCLLRLVLFLLGLWALRRFLAPALSLFLPFLLSLLCAWLLSPAVRLLQKSLRLSRPVSSLLLVLSTFGLAGGGVTALLWFGAREVWSLQDHWQELWESLSRSLSVAGDALSHLLRALPAEGAALLESLTTSVLERLNTAVPALFTSLAQQAGEAVMALPSFLISLMVFLLSTYFLTTDLPALRRRWSESLTPGGRQRMAALRTITLTAFGGYLRAQLLLTLGVFFLLALGFTLMRQPYALLLATLLAVLDFIPIVGAGTVMVPWAVISFFFGERRSALLVGALWVVVALFRRFAEPKILGGQTGLSPLLSLLAIYLGMRLGGVAGMILAPVLFLVVRNLLASGAAEGLLKDLRLLVDDLARLWEDPS